VIIVGGGPAGSSAAIRLARDGRSVLVVEKQEFPRHKVCGEFVSPECLGHFEELGVRNRLFDLSLPRFARTVFHSTTGRRLEIDNTWFGAVSGSAVGISRAAMDNALLKVAREAGAEVIEGVAARPLLEERRVVGVTLPNGVTKAAIVLDATGQARAMSGEAPRRARHVAFKTHLRNAAVERSACELFVFPGGYGGCSEVEDGLFNHCFVVTSDVVKRLGNDPETIWRETVFRNPRAAEIFRHAEIAREWNITAIPRFGRVDAVPAPGVLAIGDAASFIDPFTGSGILMALESGQLASDAVLASSDLETAAGLYLREHARVFNKRLWISSLIRLFGASTALADSLIAFLGISGTLTKILARHTRHVRRAAY